MKVEDLIEELSKYPKDYDVDISSYMTVKMDEDNEIDKDFTIVVDHPIIGLASNDETREIRFVIQGSEQDAVEDSDGGMDKWF